MPRHTYMWCPNDTLNSCAVHTYVLHWPEFWCLVVGPAATTEDHVILLDSRSFEIYHQFLQASSYRHYGQDAGYFETTVCSKFCHSRRQRKREDRSTAFLCFLIFGSVVSERRPCSLGYRYTNKLKKGTRPLVESRRGNALR